MKKLTIAILMILPTFAYAQKQAISDFQPNLVDQGVLESSLFDALGSLKQNHHTGIQAKSLNTDPSKIEALKATYTLSYKLGTVNYTDKIVINETYVDTDGEVMGRGLYFADQAGAGVKIICSYDPVGYSYLSSDYFCITYTQFGFELFAFKFSGSNVTGYYGNDPASDLAVTDLLSQAHPITGSRSSPIAALDEYVPNTGVLTLSSIKVGAEYYFATLVFEGNNRFRLQSATKTALTSANNDEYIPQTGKVILPNVKSGSDYYSVVLSDAGNSRFNLLSAVKK